MATALLDERRAAPGAATARAPVATGAPGYSPPPAGVLPQGEPARQDYELGPVPLRRYLVPVACATALVAGLPIAAVWWLRITNLVSSPTLGLALGIALSLAASAIGRQVWQRHSGSQDLLFNELLVWGFARRWLSQRRLASASDLIGPMNHAQHRVEAGLSREHQAKILQELARRLDARDPYTLGHSRRVARHAWMIASRMGLSREQVARVRTAAAIHDVGKLDTPLSVLRKPARLTDAEYEVVKRHPEDGARMVELLKDPELTAIVRHHHERLDGTGYPSGLAGEQIPLGARIVAVADTFDAISCARPYRPARTHREAIDILQQDAGTQLDPDVVRAFCSHYSGTLTVTLWATLATLPERMFSWLASGAAGAASAAQATAVAVLAGAVGAGGAAAGIPHARPHHSAAVPSAVSAQTQPGESRGAAGQSSSAGTPGASRNAPRGGSASVAKVAPGGGGLRSGIVTASGQAANQPSGNGTAATGTATGTGTVVSVSPHGAPRQSHAAEEKSSAATEGAAGAPAGHGWPAGGEGPGKSHEPPGHAKEPPGKSHEPPGHAKEPPPVMSHEPPGQAKEPPGKSHEAPGQAKEPPGKSHEPAAPPPGEAKKEAPAPSSGGESEAEAPAGEGPGKHGGKEHVPPGKSKE